MAVIVITMGLQALIINFMGIFFVVRSEGGGRIEATVQRRALGGDGGGAQKEGYRLQARPATSCRRPRRVERLCGHEGPSLLLPQVDHVAMWS